MERFISLSIGYLCGNFLTAEIVSRRSSGKSSFDVGTGNPGMANMVRQYGIGRGAHVLIGDLLKTFAACLLCRWILFPKSGVIAAAWAGLGVILGHNFPFWHHLKGGKGVTCTCAAIISISFGYGLLACILGLIGVLVFHYLPVGAWIIPAAFILPGYYIGGMELGLLLVIITLIMLSRHFSGLKNIPTGNEPKVDLLRAIKR